MGTNRDVSGGFWEEPLDETYLLQSTEPAGRRLWKKPDAWQVPAVVVAVRVRMWRWSRENKNTHRFTDIAASSLYAPHAGCGRSVCYCSSMPLSRSTCVNYTAPTSPEVGQRKLSSCYYNVEQDQSLYSWFHICLCWYWAIQFFLFKKYWQLIVKMTQSYSIE